MQKATVSAHTQALLPAAIKGCFKLDKWFAKRGYDYDFQVPSSLGYKLGLLSKEFYNKDYIIR